MEHDNQQNLSTKKSRKPNWSKKDMCTLVELYEPYHATIIGAFNPKITAVSKSNTWKLLCDAFNRSAVDTKRDESEIQTKISNMKDDARKHGTRVRQHKTGGGPPPDDAPNYIQKMYDIVHGSTGTV